MIKIRILNPQPSGELKDLDLKPETLLNQECLIGRHPNSGVVLDDPEVSRLHGKIFLREGNYYFTDFVSQGGSWVNDKSAQPNQSYLLQINDVIRIGRFNLVVMEVASAQAPTMLPPERPEIPKSNGDAAAVHVQPERVVQNSQPSAPVAPSSFMPVAMMDPDQIERWRTKDAIAVRCVRVTDETPDAKTFCFVADPPILFTYKPGQFVTLELEINGEQVLRSYSISSTPSRPHTLEITAKRVPAPQHAPETPRGLVSNWLHENITVGSEIKLSGPLGKFTCFKNPCQKLLMISAGSGITTMMSMSRWIYDTASDCDVTFFHSARSPRDIIFRQELEMMSARNPNFHLVITTTRKEPGHSWLGLTGRFSGAMLQTIAPDFHERTVYVCGPNTFMEGVKEALTGLDFPMQNYYEESFGGKKKKSAALKPDKPKEQPALAKPEQSRQPVNFKSMIGSLLSPQTKLGIDKPPVAAESVGSSTLPSPAPTKSAQSSSQLAVVFAKSGKEVDCDAEDLILDLAEQEGVKIRSSCRSGVCGTCKKRKLEGEVKMEDYETEALEDSERDEGYILTCISHPLGRVVIDA